MNLHPRLRASGVSPTTKDQTEHEIRHLPPPSATKRSRPRLKCARYLRQAGILPGPKRGHRDTSPCLAAVRLEPAQREAWLRRACGEDEDLRAEVSRLLTEDKRADGDGFLTPPESAGGSPDRTGNWPPEFRGHPEFPGTPGVPGTPYLSPVLPRFGHGFHNSRPRISAVTCVCRNTRCCAWNS